MAGDLGHWGPFWGSDSGFWKLSHSIVGQYFLMLLFLIVWGLCTLKTNTDSAQKNPYWHKQLKKSHCTTIAGNQTYSTWWIGQFWSKNINGSRPAKVVQGLFWLSEKKVQKRPMKSQHGHKSLTVCKIGKIRPLLLFQLLILHTRCHFRVISSMY